MTVTIKSLRERMEKGTADQKMRFALLMWDFQKPTYADWIELLEGAILFQVSQMATHRNYLQDSGEDLLTSVLVIGLSSLGLEATHSMVNGNCDVTIRYGDYLWIGEAKIFTGVTVVWGGYLQLTQRYSTGLPNHNKGGMLIYCIKDSAKALLAEWKAALFEQLPHCNPVDDGHPLCFRSSDVVSSSGLDISITHFSFPLLHDPVEDKIKLTKSALSAGKAAKSASRASK